MDFTAVLKALNEASGFELYRLRAAIDHVLDEPRWQQAVRRRLLPGQPVEYFNARKNALCRGTVVEFGRKHVVIEEAAGGERWRVSYAAINLDGVDVAIRNPPPQGLARHEVAVGDLIGFVDREHRQRSGRVTRLNDRTVTVDCQGQKWRVAYALLHRVVDVAAKEHTVAGLLKP